MSKIREDLLKVLLTRAKPLQIRKELELLEYSTDEIEGDLATALPNDENTIELRMWRTIFSSWDNAEGRWVENTLPRSKERRSVILRRLSIEGTVLIESLSQERNIPLNEPRIDLATIVDDPDHEDWVTTNRMPEDGWWARYRKHLEKRGTWDPVAITKLDIATTRILNHLTDPNAKILRRVKGLVVGYVQSGKTANYCALIAKAVDAGYRLVIILSGRTDILRNQTQARLDMELVGWSGLDSNEQEYYNDKTRREHQDYEGKFIESRTAKFKCLRLTKTEKDFNAGSIALHDVDVPCFAVLKKITRRLEEFAKILGKSEWRNKPVLLIDDESDDGSINTSKTKITPTAGLIAKLLQASDASQYVGYTATPYANVFIRRDRVEELFPKDFVICLDRPDHYMGALEMFDLGDCEMTDENPIQASNERAYIRPIRENPAQAENPIAPLPGLEEALDAFILAGGIKKWRESNGEMHFKHHTMLINADHLIEQHRSIAEEVEGSLDKLFPRKGLDAGCEERLERLLKNDFVPVSSSRKASTPQDWGQLKPFIEATINTIRQGNILIVNCEDKGNTPDFDEPNGCWAILVGGAKLSRGYTIEGLTTSYFSRKPGQLDTLVQMARWYGFRKGYSDLVRLYIRESLPLKRSTRTKNDRPRKKSEYRLIDAFRFGARVEEAFRANLVQYSKDVKPSDIPPLVPYEFEDLPKDFKYLRPTALNKMRSAKLETTFLGGVIRTVTRIGGKMSCENNEKQLKNFLDNCSEHLSEKEMAFNTGKQVALTALTDSKNYLDFIRRVQYSDADKSEQPRVVREQVEALTQMAPLQWRVIMFKPKNNESLPLTPYQLPGWTRNYTMSEGRLVYDKPLDPGHRRIAAWLAKNREGAGLASQDRETLALQDEKCGVIYIVPFIHKSKVDRQLFYLWCSVYPGTGKAGAYRVREESTPIA